MITSIQRYSKCAAKFMKQFLTAAVLTTLVGPAALAMNSSDMHRDKFPGGLHQDAWSVIFHHLDVYTLLTTKSVSQLINQVACWVLQSKEKISEDKCSDKKLRPELRAQVYHDLIQEHPKDVLNHLIILYGNTHHDKPNKKKKGELALIVKGIYHDVLRELHSIIQEKPQEALITQQQWDEKWKIFMSWKSCVEKKPSDEKCLVQ